MLHLPLSISFLWIRQLQTVCKAFTIRSISNCQYPVNSKFCFWWKNISTEWLSNWPQWLYRYWMVRHWTHSQTDDSLSV